MRYRTKLLLALGLAVGSMSYLWWSATAQGRAIERARSYLPNAEAVLGSDAAFGRVQASVSTGGTLVVAGAVDLQADLDRLRASMASIEAEIGVFWVVRVQR